MCPTKPTLGIFQNKIILQPEDITQSYKTAFKITYNKVSTIYVDDHDKLCEQFHTFCQKCVATFHVQKHGYCL